MDKSWYLDECDRQLNDTTFYQQLRDDNLTTNIQLCVEEYVNGMHRYEHIDDKTKRFYTFFPRSIKQVTRDVRFYLITELEFIICLIIMPLITLDLTLYIQ